MCPDKGGGKESSRGARGSGRGYLILLQEGRAWLVHCVPAKAMCVSTYACVCVCNAHIYVFVCMLSRSVMSKHCRIQFITLPLTCRVILGNDSIFQASAFLSVNEG